MDPRFARLDALFPGMQVLACYLFRLTRYSDLEISHTEEPEDLLAMIEEQLFQRRFGQRLPLDDRAHLDRAAKAGGGDTRGQRRCQWASDSRIRHGCVARGFVRTHRHLHYYYFMHCCSHSYPKPGSPGRTCRNRVWNVYTH